jgi:hypothetical protein
MAQSESIRIDWLDWASCYTIWCGIDWCMSLVFVEWMWEYHFIFYVAFALLWLVVTLACLFACVFFFTLIRYSLVELNHGISRWIERTKSWRPFSCSSCDRPATRDSHMLRHCSLIATINGNNNTQWTTMLSIVLGLSNSNISRSEFYKIQVLSSAKCRVFTYTTKGKSIYYSRCDTRPTTFVYFLFYVLIVERSKVEFTMGLEFERWFIFIIRQRVVSYVSLSESYLVEGLLDNLETQLWVMEIEYSWDR